METNDEVKDEPWNNDDEKWKSEGRYRNHMNKWIKENRAKQEADREKWVKERVKCTYCGFYMWPHELDRHETGCRERF